MTTSPKRMPQQRQRWSLGFNKAQMLQSFPELGYKYSSTEEGDIRILLYGHYRIAYLIKGKESIDILGVFHGSLEIDRYLA